MIQQPLAESEETIRVESSFGSETLLSFPPTSHCRVRNCQNTCKANRQESDPIIMVNRKVYLVFFSLSLSSNSPFLFFADSRVSLQVSLQIDRYGLQLCTLRRRISDRSDDVSAPLLSWRKLARSFKFFDYPEARPFCHLVEARLVQLHLDNWLVVNILHSLGFFAV